MKKITKIAGSLGLMGCAVINMAVADDSGWYMGANVGRSMGNIDDDAISAQLMATGVTSVTIDEDDRDTGYKLFGGYQYNKNFALEGGYFDLGQLGYTATTVPAGTLAGEADISGLNLDLVGMYPFSSKFSAFGRFGLNYAQTEDTFSSTGIVPVPADPDPGKNALNYKFGVGLQYDFTEALGMRAEVERYRINDAVGNKADVDLVSIGLIYRFGEKKSHPVRQAEHQVIVPVKTKTEEYCTVLDIEFDIKQNQVHVEDREKMAALATFMKKYPNTTAVIEGHSDNVGDSDYNLKLSRQRADSVVEYLVKEHQINASRLKAVAYGETRPRAYNMSSEGQQSNRRVDAVIACVDDIAGLKVAPTRITMALELEFDPYKHEIKSKYRSGLDHVAEYMKANPSVVAVVEGHADRVVGTGAARTKVDAETSMKISQNRAQSVVNYLVNELGIAKSRLNIASYGQTDRVTYGTTLDAQQENRRVNIILIYPKS
ncbi:MAG: OmpA family protein [Gammaproteobacteria bacterium]|nr:OmpA family protein [Gammaproteobacteria bacterium]